MGFITELKADFYRRNGVFLGSTTNVIEANMDDALDIIGNGWATFPMADSTAVSLAAENRVCVISATTSMLTATVIVGQLIIMDVDEPEKATDPQILKISGPSLLHELTYASFGYNVLSDGNNGPSPSPILDLFAIYDVDSPISFSYQSTGTAGTSKAYLVGSGESVFDALLQVVQTDNGHISLANGGYGTFTYPYYGVQFWWSNAGLYGGPPLWFDELKLNNTLPASQLPNPIINIDPQRTKHDVVTRVYVYGAGMGDSKFTFADKTDADPFGFTSTPSTSLIVNNELENVIDQPIITKTIQFGNIKPEDAENTTAVQSAANALFAAGVQHLRNNDGRTSTIYHVETYIWMNHTCGQAVHLRYVDDSHDIDEELILVEYKLHATKDGLLKANLVLSPSPTKQVTGPRLAASKIKQLETTINHANAGAASSSPPSGGGGGEYLKVAGSPPALAGNMTVNAGVTIDGMDPSEMKISEFLMFAASSETTRGRVLQTANGLNLLDGGIGADATLQLILKALSGLTVDGDGLSLATPATLAHNSQNSVTGAHSHAVDASSNPSTQAFLLKTDATGRLQLARLDANSLVLTDRQSGQPYNLFINNGHLYIETI